MWPARAEHGGADGRSTADAHQRPGSGRAACELGRTSRAGDGWSTLRRPELGGRALPRRMECDADGAVLGQAVARKRRKYADVHASHQAALVVLGCDVYGRWGEDAVRLIRELAALKARQAPPLLRGCAQHAWSNCWWSMLGVGVHRAIAESLLRHGGPDLLPSAPPSCAPPLADVLLDA